MERRGHPSPGHGASRQHSPGHGASRRPLTRVWSVEVTPHPGMKRRGPHPQLAPRLPHGCALAIAPLAAIPEWQRRSAFLRDTDHKSRHHLLYVFYHEKECTTSQYKGLKPQ